MADERLGLSIFLRSRLSRIRRVVPVSCVNSFVVIAALSGLFAVVISIPVGIYNLSKVSR